MIELYNLLENNRVHIVSAMLTRIPKEIPAYSRTSRNDLKQSVEYLLEAFTDLIVTGDDANQKTYFKYLAKVRSSQSFKLGDVCHKHMLFLSVVRPILQEKCRDINGDGLALYNRAMEYMERNIYRSVNTFIDVYQEYLSSRRTEHQEYVDEQNKQLGVDMSKYITFRG